MATSREQEGPTPSGGVKVIMHFQDDKGNPVEESRAQRVEILEMDAEGKEIARTYGTVNGSGSASMASIKSKAKKQKQPRSKK